MALVRLSARYFTVGLSTVSVCSGAWRDGDRRAGPKVEGLILDPDNHSAIEDVIGLAPASSVQWGGRPPRRVDLEELILIVGMFRIDLHRENRVRQGELDALARGGVLNQMCHTSDARFAA